MSAASTAMEDVQPADAWDEGLPPPDVASAVCRVFLCICGDDRAGAVVVCEGCGCGQHLLCSGFLAEEAEAGAFRCGECLQQAPPVPVRATLVISPSAIAMQWQHEAVTKVAGLSVYVYTGPRSAAGHCVRPAVFARHDIVITTYDTLARDLAFTGLRPNSSGGGRRRRQRFARSPTPLSLVEWWRVCLDEAQMVESTAARPARMASTLPAVHRWCVTGTPVSQDVDELRGLLAFLRVPVFSQRTWWNLALRGAASAAPPAPTSSNGSGQVADALVLRGLRERLRGLVLSLLWRSSKAGMGAEWRQPQQHQQETVVRLGAAERYFYNRLGEQCRAAVVQAVAAVRLGYVGPTLWLGGDSRYVLGVGCVLLGGGGGGAPGPLCGAPDGPVFFPPFSPP